MLSPGLYEQVINTALNRELSEISEARKSVAPIDKAEASIAQSSVFTGAIYSDIQNDIVGRQELPPVGYVSWA